MKFQFQKYLFNTSINGVSVTKSVGEDGCIRLQIEGLNRRSSGHNSLIFVSQNEFEDWIDEVVDDETAHYNKAAALKRVLDAWAVGKIRFVIKKYRIKSVMSCDFDEGIKEYARAACQGNEDAADLLLKDFYKSDEYTSQVQFDDVTVTMIG